MCLKFKIGESVEVLWARGNVTNVYYDAVILDIGKSDSEMLSFCIVEACNLSIQNYSIAHW